MQDISLFVSLTRTDLHQRGGQAEDRLRVVGQQLQRSSQMQHRLISAFESQQHVAQIAPRVTVIGVDLDGSFESLQRLLGLAHPVVRAADADSGVRVTRVQLDYAFQADDSFVELASQQGCHGPIRAAAIVLLLV